MAETPTPPKCPLDEEECEGITHLFGLVSQLQVEVARLQEALRLAEEDAENLMSVGLQLKTTAEWASTLAKCSPKSACEQCLWAAMCNENSLVGHVADHLPTWQAVFAAREARLKEERHG